MLSDKYKQANSYLLWGVLLSCFLFLGLTPWNNPYPEENKNSKTLYTSFSEQAKHLDPALSYAANEWVITNQIYEPPLQYNYLKRPYTLEPLTAQEMPIISFENQDGKLMTVYNIKIKPGIYYHEHPAFASYPHKTRELVAADFVYQIKRLLDSTLNSPILGFMKSKISKVEIVSQYHYQIYILGQYPQFIYWLAMPFFAPMPWEVIQYYNNPLLKKKNQTLDTSPIGTGPFWLSENNPNARMVLKKNPTYHARPAFLDKIIFSLEKETIPYWNKFLQGYYDQSGISSDSFDQALQSANNNTSLELTSELKAKKMQLNTAVLPHIFYWGFNMLDPTVGGYTLEKRKLRQAISIAMDIEEYIDLFMNGRGIAAQGPVPEGIFGFVPLPQGMNSVVYQKDAKGEIQRKSLAVAKKLLAEAGYPEGIDPKTKQPLILYLDATMGGGADSNSLFAWTRKQFQKLNIELVVRATQYNRFQEKMRTGNAQIFSWGWNADYPDPENFLFLLYGPNGKVKDFGENAVNYLNPEYDRLFEQMKVLPDGPQRQNIINQMVEILRQDSPWIWGYNPLLYSLSQQWMSPPRPNAFAQNTLKYVDINPQLRFKMQQLWNQPKIWPFGVAILCFLLLCLPAVLEYKRKMNKKGPS